MQEFLQHNGTLPHEPIQPLEMEQLRRDLDGFRINAQQNQASGSGWAQEFDGSRVEHANPEFQRARYQEYLHATQTEALPVNDYLNLQQSSAQQNGFHNQSSFTPRMVGYSSGFGVGIRTPFQSGFDQYRANGQAATDKGKGRMVELDDKDWENQFEAMQSATKDDARQEDLDAEANEAMEEELNDVDRSVHTEANLGDFESIWRGIEAEMRSVDGMDRMLGQDHAFDTSSMPTGDEIPLSHLGAWDGFDSQFTEGFRDPQLGNYLFEQDNPFQGTGNPFEEGVKIMKEGGNLSLAALAFEAAVQQKPDHVQAWYQLGTAQAQNEKETPAIRALEQALKLDPSNLGALMGLAISYTNEGYDSTAFRTLERWLATKYPQIISPEELTQGTDYGFTDRHFLHEKVTDLFIKAAQLSPTGEQMDPDVQVGLGVLFYGAEEYSKAVDCFEAALASTEEGTTNEPGQAHLLWNRLGATLANSGRSEDAIGAYEKALTLNPNFVRARYNLGVSCINIGVFEQAVQHLLGALAMHNVVEKEGMDRIREVIGEDKGEDEVDRMVGMNQSTNLIETLRRVFGTMGRRDLAERVERGMDVDAFRGEFDF